jgi:2-polyprenyl-3-methyl-5-hydroxy-6-metoxy-1,4-benzoquinol methylase
MVNNALKDHYEKKYEKEKEAVDIEQFIESRYTVTRFEAILKLFPKYFKGGDVLELGAGSGIIAKMLLSSELPISSYTLSDISENRLHNIKDNLNDHRVDVKIIDAEKPPEDQNNKYDSILMIALIEHLIDPLNSMQRIRELLKPNGFVLLFTPNIAKYTRRIKLLTGSFPSTASVNEGLTTYSGMPADLHDEGHLHYFTYRSLSLMLTERCNFSKTVKLSYPHGKVVFGKYIDKKLAKLWPELFSDVLLIAYA